MAEWIELRNESSLEMTVPGRIDLLFSDSDLPIREAEVRRFLPQVNPQGLVLLHDASSHLKTVREAAQRLEAACFPACTCPRHEAWWSRSAVKDGCSHGVRLGAKFCEERGFGTAPPPESIFLFELPLGNLYFRPVGPFPGGTAAHETT